jgi:licheninase
VSGVVAVDTPRIARATMLAGRTAAAMVAAVALALTGYVAASARDRPAAVTAVAAASDGTQAAVARGWGPVVAGDEFNYAGPPDRAKWKVYKGPGHAARGGEPRMRLL